MELLHLISLLLALSVLHHSAATSLTSAALTTQSGYLPVNSNSNSSIFYTFYEAQKPTSSLSETPLIIWLQGGPGCSSMLGNFFELGPWRVTLGKNIDHPVLVPNPASWNRLFGLIFLDNPIGVGFSIASAPEEIPTDQQGVAEHLFKAISVFLARNPGFRSRSVYVTGESYAGKYVPAFGYHVLRRNPLLPKSKRVNLAGVAIGNGLTDPITQVATHAITGYYLGLINEKEKTRLEKLQNDAVDLTKRGSWSKAARCEK